MKGASPMPIYITLIRFTQKGMEAIKEGPARLDAAKQAFQALGAKIKDFYLVTGKYDAVVVAEAPDDETIVKLSLRPPVRWWVGPSRGTPLLGHHSLSTAVRNARRSRTPSYLSRHRRTLGPSEPPRISSSPIPTRRQLFVDT